MRNLSLQYKTALRISILILCVSAIVTGSLLARSYLVFKQDLYVSSNNLGRITARTVTSSMLHDDVWQVYEIISAPFIIETRESSLQAEMVVVLDQDNHVFVSTTPRRYPISTDPFVLNEEFAKLENALAGEYPLSSKIVEMPGFGNIYVITPIESDGVLLGRLVMMYSHELFISRFYSFVRQAVLTTLIVIALLLPIGVYWGRRIAAPLVELSQCMRDIGTSIPESLDCRIYKGKDEIGQLGEQFEKMIDQLREKQVLEKQMVVSDRLAAIGRFTAGIAHEINNPLGGLLNATNTLQSHGSQDPLTRKTVSLLERGLVQIKETVAALLVEANPETHAVTPQDIEDTRTLILSAAAGKFAQFEWANEVQQPVDLPSTHVRQILINLLLNAINAIPDKGKLSCRIEADHKELTITTWNEGEQISDTELETLFEPFSGIGGAAKGLGLWVTYQIINTLKGSIEVSSGPDDTRFLVVLPLKSA
ncbi:HAMP domain-containing histidine kinase [Gammaproteobacteria bacterium]|nr:HAMP domain-containing histidine kinase [Gammaproteobacteria bacterium]